MNYGQLKDAVNSYLHRSDAVPLLPLWLSLTEGRIYNGEQNSPALRIASMHKCALLTSFERPSDFLEARLVHEGDNQAKTLDLVALTDVAHSTRAYAWDGECIALSPDQSLPISLHYYARFTPLVADSDTNALLTNSPNIYLSSMLVEAARWSRDDALGAREAANYGSAVDSLHSADKAAKYSGSLLTMKPKGRNP